VLLVVVYVGLSGRGGLSRVCALALVLGWFADLFAGSEKGLHMIAYAAAGLAARGASWRLLVRGALLTALVAGVFALADGALVVALRTSLMPSLGWSALRQVAPSALVTALFAPLAFRLLGRIDRSFIRDPRLGDGMGRSLGGLS
jgi:cell shape-determining protein MreD